MQSAWVVLSCLLSAVGTVPAAGTEASCCFANQAYSGVCRVTPTGDETCQSILDYLNTPNSVGKAYCGETNIRGGWQRTSCK